MHSQSCAHQRQNLVAAPLNHHNHDAGEAQDQVLLQILSVFQGAETHLQYLLQSFVLVIPAKNLKAHLNE